MKDIAATRGGDLSILEVRYSLPNGGELAVAMTALSINAFVQSVYERYLTTAIGGIVGRKDSTWHRHVRAFSAAAGVRMTKSTQHPNTSAYLSVQESWF